MPEDLKPNTQDSKLIIRCPWCGEDPLYQQYHDEEWGREVRDDKTMFEFLLLESAQAGLSWITILRKRENYRKAFADFDVNKVAAFTEKDVERLLQNEGIIRNKLKITSAISNAKLFIDIQKEFGSFCKYIWGFLPNGKPIINQFVSTQEVPARTEISDAISKDMKKRGFKFFGTTICYAHMQATGMVNDHILECHVRK
ncbi:DNA-3-methyladenine glycosylase I [Solitalea sp. MAHUQ-68]|uniref:DNA-3-methyladenine glycosylase I n=1 Tax=Solitalea agri TaxID=2953739 RepID=A0A9X2F1D9_9SPHI|nr:DNA-3-methyladenine glycosylase I [Solitalea agri]MCO4292889.1 DNA-3-methyladenine glycosylase I [Solitalea agri]